MLQRFEIRGVVIILLVTAVLLWSHLRKAPAITDWRNETTQRYEYFWRSLEVDALTASNTIAPLLRTGEVEELGFTVLREALTNTSVPSFSPRPSFLLFSPDGEVEAWAGEGLQHEPVPGSKASRRLYTRGVTATTLWVERELLIDKRTWHLVVGVSFSDSNLIFSSCPIGSGTTWYFTEPIGDGGELNIKAAGGAPEIRFKNLELKSQDLPDAIKFPLIPILIVILIVRGARDSGVKIPIIVGTPYSAFCYLLVAVSEYSIQKSMCLSTFCPLRSTESELAAQSILAILLTMLIHASSRQLIIPFATSASTSAWLSILFGLLGSGFQDHLKITIICGVFGSFMAADFWSRTRSQTARGLSSVSVFLLLNAVLATSTWQAIDRELFRNYVEGVLVDQLAPPDSEEQNELLAEFQSYFESTDLGAFVPEGEANLQDLAFALWRASPLALRGGLSALVVEAENGEASSFSFGLPLDVQSNLQVETIALWPFPQAQSWRDSLILGQATFHSKGEAWGSIRYYFQPRPGFQIPRSRINDYRTSLVKGGRLGKLADGLPSQVSYALYGLDGKVVSSPWPDLLALPKSLLVRSRDSVLVYTPIGKCWTWFRRGVDGIETIFLPVVDFRDGLEKTGFQVLLVLFICLAVGMVALADRSLLNETASLVRDFVQSYSRRLILIHILLLMVPLVSLNLIILRDFIDHVKENQLASAQSAMYSARSMLHSYLRGLEPGFLIETVINRELLQWISGLVNHQVNVYWGSQVYASSQQELFTAGLLPRRIPGEVYTRLTFEGAQLGYRSQTVGNARYLEVYAPLDIAQMTDSQQGLFLSVPLLEQEAEVAAESSAIAKRSLLMSLSLLSLLIAVSGWLARRFTEPIVDLIEDTRRISQGGIAQSPRPRELELHSLAEAIEEMSTKIAESRCKLMAEKEFVELVVANIASGVLSIGTKFSILRQNRVAAVMLGTQVGDNLEDIFDEECFAEVAGFVKQAAVEATPTARRVRVRRTVSSALTVDEWSLVWVPLEVSEALALLVIDDVTEILRGQRLEAWAEMARIIAHEVKNPLTPIRLTTEHLRQVYRTQRSGFDAIFERCTENVLRHVEELQAIASEFSIYSRIPQAHLENENLVQVVRDLVLSYSELGDQSSKIVVESEYEIIPMRLDRRLICRALRNLLENSLRAQGSRGKSEIRVLLSRASSSIRVQVLDEGSGVDSQAISRIFEPYFSTRESGTGLGLAITKKIVEEHGGRILASNRPSGGFSIEMIFPDS